MTRTDTAKLAILNSSKTAAHIEEADKLAGGDQVVIGDADHDLLVWGNALQYLLQLRARLVVPDLQEVDERSVSLGQHDDAAQLSRSDMTARW